VEQLGANGKALENFVGSLFFSDRSNCRKLWCFVPCYSEWGFLAATGKNPAQLTIPEKPEELFVFLADWSRICASRFRSENKNVATVTCLSGRGRGTLERVGMSRTDHRGIGLWEETNVRSTG
jgi:hypothetical protein